MLGEMKACDLLVQWAHIPMRSRSGTYLQDHFSWRKDIFKAGKTSIWFKDSIFFLWIYVLKIKPSQQTIETFPYIVTCQIVPSCKDIITLIQMTAASDNSHAIFFSHKYSEKSALFLFSWHESLVISEIKYARINTRQYISRRYIIHLVFFLPARGGVLHKHQKDSQKKIKKKRVGRLQ